MSNFKSIGLSFKETPLEIREHLALDESAIRELLRYLRDFTDASDALVLSTCNRTEVYYCADQDLTEAIFKGFSWVRRLENIRQYKKYFIGFGDHQQVVQRLFNVSMGLEAQVIGDMQISNQVKSAYQWSADEEMAGPFLHRLMHTIFYTNKRVVQETPFRDGAASVSYAAKELIEDLTEHIKHPKVLVLGLGEIGIDVCRNMVNSRIKEVYISNRTAEKATAIAAECGFQTIPFEKALDFIQEVDVVISSINRSKPFIEKSALADKPILTHKFFVDLAVPRSIDHRIEDIPGVLLYNIDNIRSKASKALEKRMAAIPDVKAIVNESIREFNDWSRDMIVSPTIKKLKNALEQIRREELARHLKNSTDKEAQIIDKVTKSLMQKVMKLPVLQLKAACKRGEAETLIDVLTDLFDLEKHSEKAKEA